MRAWAQIDGADEEEVPLAWIAERLPKHLPFVETMRNGAEALLAASDHEVRAWIAAGEGFAREIRKVLQGEAATAVLVGGG